MELWARKINAMGKILYTFYLRGLAVNVQFKTLLSGLGCLRY